MKKNYLLLLTTFFCASLTVQSQTRSVIVGDTLFLNVDNAIGQIQWEESIDSISWHELVGATTAEIIRIVPTTGTNKAHYRVAVSDPICPNASPWYSNVVSFMVYASTADVQPGDYFRGGRMFIAGYTNAGGTETPGIGLIACTHDYSASVWGCDGVDIPNSSENINGNSNTANIYTYCADMGAAYWASEYSVDGYNDWFLPAIYQMSWLYGRKDFVGNFQSSGSYWTSTQYDAANAYYMYYGWGGGYTGNYATKNANLQLRFIRAFGPSDALRHDFGSVQVNFTPSPLNIVNQPMSQNICLGNTASFVVTPSGTAPYQYQWKKDGNIIADAIDSILIIDNATINDNGVYTCEISNLCNSITSQTAELNVVQLSASINPVSSVCQGQMVALVSNVSSNFPSISGTLEYVWTPNTGLSNDHLPTTEASPTNNTTYELLVNDQLNCQASASVDVQIATPYTNQQLCLVTVDPNTGKNKVMFEKTPNSGIAEYKIYKEGSTTGDYNCLGTLEPDEVSEWLDINSQPEVHGDKYKMSIVDTCGHESGLSYYHKTVNLIIGNSGSTMGLLWDDYVDESGGFIPYRYYIYKGTSPDNLQLFDSVPGTLNSYNDVNVYDVYYYMIGVKKLSGCGTSSRSALVAFSNKKDNSAIVNTLTKSIEKNTFTVSPNPFSGSALVEWPSSFWVSEWTVYDLAGHVVIKGLHQTNQNHFVLDLSGIKAGMYFLELNHPNLIRTKLVLESH